jgi:hypothetical protein
VGCPVEHECGDCDADRSGKLLQHGRERRRARHVVYMNFKVYDSVHENNELMNNALRVYHPRENRPKAGFLQ